MVYLEPKLASAARGQSSWSSRAVPTWLLVLALALAALITRAAPFGDPVVHVDDEFYLLVGKVMSQGGWPYVDIWDRKPVGLFAIYAAVAAVAGDWAVEGVQLLAGLFAFATALVVAVIGRRLSNDWGGLLAGVTYLICITLFGGEAGQSPVFYNLLIASAALLLVRSIEDGDAAAVTRRALAAMALCGLAMTIKQISFIEGGFLGLAFLWQFRRHGLSLPATALRALAMMAVALAPTALALGIYLAAGHGEEFIFANFVSIFLKRPVGGRSIENGLTTLAQLMPPIAMLAAWGALQRWRRGMTGVDRFMLGWIAAAIAGYLFVPYFFDHYALPLMVPLSISAATILGQPFGGAFVLLLGHLAATQAGLFNFPKHASRAEAADTLSRVIARELRGGCLYLVSGRTHFYNATGACRLSRYVFPDHLNDSAEIDGIGVNQLAEVKRVFAQKPAVVVTDRHNEWRRSPATKAFIDGELRRHYRLVYKLPGTKPRNLTELRIWSRIDR